MRTIWEKAIRNDGYDTLELALEEYNTDLDSEIRRYEIALLMRDFEFDLVYPTVRLESHLESPAFMQFPEGIGQLGADFHRISGEGVITVQSRQLKEGMLVAIEDDEADIYPLIDGLATLNADLYERIYLIVINFDRAEEISDCAFAPYSIEVRAGEGVDSPIETIPTANFLPPFVEELTPVER